MADKNAIVLTLRRGTKAENDAFTGAEAELSVDTTSMELRLHDGKTAGGKIIGGKPDLSGYLTTTDASNTYLSKTDASNTYLSKTDASNTYATKWSVPAAQVQSDWNATSGLGAILNKPTIPTNTSQLWNDSGFLTSHQSLDSCAKWTGGTFSGWIYAPGFKSTSDVRLKSDVAPKKYDLSSLGTYRYVLKQDGQPHVGLIAQEVRDVIPEAVSEREDGYLVLDYNAVVAALVSEVNSLKARVAVLENNHE